MMLTYWSSDEDHVDRMVPERINNQFNNFHNRPAKGVRRMHSKNSFVRDCHISYTINTQLSLDLVKRYCKTYN